MQPFRVSRAAGRQILASQSSLRTLGISSPHRRLHRRQPNHNTSQHHSCPSRTAGNRRRDVISDYRYTNKEIHYLRKAELPGQGNERPEWCRRIRLAHEVYLQDQRQTVTTGLTERHSRDPSPSVDNWKRQHGEESYWHGYRCQFGLRDGSHHSTRRALANTQYTFKGQRCRGRKGDQQRALRKRKDESMAQHSEIGMRGCSQQRQMSLSPSLRIIQYTESPTTPTATNGLLEGEAGSSPHANIHAIQSGLDTLPRGYMTERSQSGSRRHADGCWCLSVGSQIMIPVMTCGFADENSCGVGSLF